MSRTREEDLEGLGTAVEVVRLITKIGFMLVSNEKRRRDKEDPSFTDEDISDAVNAAIGCINR